MAYAELSSERVEHTVYYRLEGVPDVTDTVSLSKRRIRPDRLRIEYRWAVDHEKWVAGGIIVYGSVVKKDGTPGAVRAEVGRFQLVGDDRKWIEDFARTLRPIGAPGEVPKLVHASIPAEGR